MDHNHLLSPEELRALLLEDGEEGSNEALESTLLQRAELDLKKDVMELKEVVRLLQMRVEFLENLLQGHLKADPTATPNATPVSEKKHTPSIDDSKKNDNAAVVSPAIGLVLPPRSERHARTGK